jgi:phosphatidylethanolamine/phosphatidyl-N-methylethanolamine N-methyltransferase
VNILNQRFAEEQFFRQAAGQSTIHSCLLQDFEAAEPYDFIISGLPLNNFSPELVSDIFESYFRLLKPGGLLSYFEYMYVRPIRSLVSKSDEKTRLKELGRIMDAHIAEHRYRRSWVFINFPPAWVQHLRKPADTAGECVPADNAVEAATNASE